MKKVLIPFLILIACTLVHAQQGEIPAKGIAHYDGHFHNIDFTRHAIGDNDIQIEILYSGICHSDFGTLATSTKENPVVPGHEMIGRVMKVGKNVTKFKVGDYAGVGCMVNSCGACGSCEMDKQQFCETTGVAFTYGGTDPYHGNRLGMGGYADHIVVSERFAMTIPENTDIKRAAPLLCAGATTWSAIKYKDVKQGDKVGVAGFGGLGHMAVKYLVDLGAEVTIFDITEDKRADAIHMGAKRYVNVKDPAQLKGLNNTYDFILSTIPADYDATMYMQMLKRESGELAIVGMPSHSTINIVSAIMPNAHRKIWGSLIAGTKETQEMFDYSVANNIYPEIEVINADLQTIDKAYQEIEKGNIKFRYVIDMQTMK